MSDPNNAQLSGVKSVSDDVTLVHYGVTSNFTDKNVGTDKSVLTTGFDIEGMDIVNYYLEQPSPKANINPIVLNITGVTADNKVYDGTTKATLSKNSAALVGSIIPNENVTLITDGADGTFVDENAGTGKSVTFNGISITGTDAGNYLLANTTVSGTANITPRTLAVSAVGVDKPYDGLPSATVTLTDNRVVGDILTISHTAAFNDKNVGMGKPVTVSVLPITGTDAANYMLESTTATTTANISSVGLAALTITGVTVNSKVYDGTTTATLNTTAAALSGVISPDVVTLNKSNATGTFADKNVGTGIAVTTAGFALGGADAGNYTMTNPAITNSITAKPLTITANSSSKCFGVTPTFLGTEITPVTGLIGTDAVTGVTLTSAGTLATAAAGTYPIVASTAVGTGLTNYSFNYVNGTMTVDPAQAIPVVTIDALLQVIMTSNATIGNQWYSATGIITGATSQTYTATQNGNYYVKVTGTCATTQSVSVSITHVSIPEFEKSAIKVYPNPNQGEFWVNFKASGNEKLKMIQVYNRLGKAVYQATPSSVTNELTERVSIKSQPAGVYILVLTTDNQRISRQIVITK